MKYTTFKIIYTNFWSHPVRSLGLVVLTAIASAMLLSGVIFSKSLDIGFERLSSRMGADLLVVPYGVETQNQSILLQGGLSHRVLPREVLEFTRKLPGVSVASPQFYFTTLSASCCDKKVNIIGFDSKTDFTIKPWIRKTYKNEFKPGYIIAGNDIDVEKGGKIKFFDKEFTVVGTLEPLGNKLDQAIFADVETIELLRQAAASKGFDFISEGNPSAVLANLEDGADVERISQEILEHFDNLQVIPRKNMFDSVVAAASSFKIAAWIIAGVFLFIVIAAVFIAFSISTNERNPPDYRSNTQKAHEHCSWRIPDCKRKWGYCRNSFRNCRHHLVPFFNSREHTNSLYTPWCINYSFNGCRGIACSRHCGAWGFVPHC